MTGSTWSTDFPTQNPYQGSHAGGLDDIFVTKLNTSGNALVYSTYLGGNDNESTVGIAVDSSGNAYIAGNTRSTDFPTQNPYQGSYAGGGDVFVTKLNTSGNALVYSTYLGGSGEEIASAIAVDSFGNVYIAGTTPSTNFPTLNPYQGSNAGWYDAFVAKFSPSYILTFQKNGTGTGTVTSNPPGIDCGSDCSELYGQGQLVTLIPTPGLFSVLTEWSGGGCSGNGVCVVNLMEDTTVTATFDVSPIEGTLGTQVTVPGTSFGTKKGKVLIGGASTKIIVWNPSSITIEVTKSLPLGPHPVVLTLKEPKGIAPITIPGAFIMMAPEIVTIDLNSGSPGHVRMISGNYFGKKKGKVYLEDQSTGQKKSCKVTYWSMDLTTGISSLNFVVPKLKGYVPGVFTTYNLKVTNKVGTATTTFRID